MPTKLILTQLEINGAAQRVANKIKSKLAEVTQRPVGKTPPLMIYGIPRGGIPAAYAVAAQLPGSVVVDHLAVADVVVDDIYDTGDTMRRTLLKYHPQLGGFALFTRGQDVKDEWLVFPWEHNEEQDEGLSGNITRILQYIGEDPNRGGLRETPHRVERAWQEWTRGYNQDPGAVLKCFEDGADGVDEMVVVRDIPFYSHCEHHMAPFFGTVTIGYVPSKKIVGLSKLSRLTDIFAKRLQVQERMTNQIADALQQHLEPRGVGVYVRARHLCMESRGVAKQGSTTATSALRGVLRTDSQARAEFLAIGAATAASI